MCIYWIQWTSQNVSRRIWRLWKWTWFLSQCQPWPPGRASTFKDTWNVYKEPGRKIQYKSSFMKIVRIRDGHADADRMLIRNMSRIYRAISDICRIKQISASMRIGKYIRMAIPSQDPPVQCPFTFIGVGIEGEVRAWIDSEEETPWGLKVFFLPQLLPSLALHSLTAFDTTKSSNPTTSFLLLCHCIPCLCPAQVKS